MKRRHFLMAPVGVLTGVAMADTPKVQKLDDVLQWLDRLDRATEVRSTT